MRNWTSRTAFVTGASRGIGRAIALRVAAEGANVVVAAKTTEPHPDLPGTIHTTAEEVEAAGGHALAVEVDVRDEERVAEAVERAVERFGGIDVLVNNASAIWLAPTLDTPVKRYDLMHDVNVRGTFVCTKACAPWLERGDNPHVLVLSPPIDLDPRWFARHAPYTLSKYGMSMLVTGLAEELRPAGVAVNALWPRTVIATAALRLLGDRVRPEQCRRPEIVADAARAILERDARSCTGNFFVDEDVLRHEGITEFESYAVEPGTPLATDLFLAED